MSRSSQAPIRPIRQRFGRGDLRMLPLAAAAWGITWTAVQEYWLVLAGFGAVAVVIGGWSIRRSWWTAGAVCLIIIGVGASAGFHSWRLASDPIRSIASEYRVAEVVAEVVVPANYRGAMQLRVLSVAQQPSRAEVWVSRVSPAWRTLIRGDVISGYFGLSWSDWTIFATPRHDPQLVRPANPADQLVEKVRAGLRQSATILPEVDAALLPALVLGDTAKVTDGISQVFQDTGLTHLMAVSGANLSLLLVFVRSVAVRVGVRGWWLSLVALVNVVGFVALCHGEPSVLRAAAMGVVAYVGLSFARNDALRYLSIAIILLLLFEPKLSTSWGFTLSVAATLGIITLGSELVRRWSKLPQLVAQAIAVPLAAQLATAPIIVALSQTLSVVGVFANIVAAPFVAPATISGFLAAAFGWWWPTAGQICAVLAGIPTRAIWWIASVGATMPGATWQISAAPVPFFAIVIGCVALAVVLRHTGSRLAIGIIGLGLLILISRPPLVLGWPPPQWEVAACDVGQGDAWVFAAGPGAAVLVDTGPEPKLVSRCLAGLGVSRVPLLIITHPHADHLGGWPGVQSVTDQVLVGPGIHLSGATTIAARAETRYQVGRVAITIWRVEPAGEGASIDEGESAAQNNASLAGLVEVNGLRILFAGDSEPEAQQPLLKRVEPVDILLVPHHGSRRQDPEFLAASQARLALISVGKGNPFGHPTKQTLNWLAPIPIYRTDIHGDIGVANHAGGFNVYARA